MEEPLHAKQCRSGSNERFSSSCSRGKDINSPTFTLLPLEQFESLSQFPVHWQILPWILAQL